MDVMEAALKTMVGTAVDKAVAQAIDGIKVEMKNLRDEVRVLRKRVALLEEPVNDCVESDESVDRKRRKKSVTSPTPLETTETLSQLSQLTQPEDDSDEHFYGTQITQNSPVKLAVKGGHGVVLDTEESPDAGLALALQCPRANVKHIRSKLRTTAADLPKLQPGKWTHWPVSGSAPIGRWGASTIFTGDGRLVVYGGERDLPGCDGATLGDLHVFHAASGKWQGMKAAESTPRCWHTATYLPESHCIIVFGGERKGFDGLPEPLAEPMCLDTELMFWYPPVISGIAPAARVGHSACLVEQTIVLFGGCRGRKWLADVFALDTAAWKWRRPRVTGRPPCPRSYHSATIMNDCIVFFGGNDKQECYNDVHVLHIEGAQWKWTKPQVVGSAPLPRSGHSATAIGSDIVITGGWDPQDEDSDLAPFTDAFLLNTVKWEWRQLKSTNWVEGRVGHSGALLNADKRTLISFGGQGIADRFGDLQLLQIPEAFTSKRKRS